MELPLPVNFVVPANLDSFGLGCCLAAAIGAALMMLTRCLTVDEAWRAIAHTGSFLTAGAPTLDGVHRQTAGRVAYQDRLRSRLMDS